jgi:hypothetical protein
MEKAGYFTLPLRHLWHAHYFLPDSHWTNAYFLPDLTLSVFRNFWMESCWVAFPHAPDCSHHYTNWITEQVCSYTSVCSFFLNGDVADRYNAQRSIMGWLINNELESTRKKWWLRNFMSYCGFYRCTEGINKPTRREPNMNTRPLEHEAGFPETLKWHLILQFRPFKNIRTAMYWMTTY